MFPHILFKQNAKYFSSRGHHLNSLTSIKFITAFAKIVFRLSTLQNDIFMHKLLTVHLKFKFQESKILKLLKVKWCMTFKFYQPTYFYLNYHVYL